jgi:hypothetical protein
MLSESGSTARQMMRQDACIPTYYETRRQGFKRYLIIVSEYIFLFSCSSNMVFRIFFHPAPDVSSIIFFSLEPSICTPLRFPHKQTIICFGCGNFVFLRRLDFPRQSVFLNETSNFRQVDGGSPFYSESQFSERFVNHRSII